jgi:ankyrin
MPKFLDYLHVPGIVDQHRADGRTALHLAAQAGHIPMLRALLSRGANVNAATPSGDTALHFASYAGQDLALRCLLDAGANVHARALDGLRPIDVAAPQSPCFFLLRDIMSGPAHQL